MGLLILLMLGVVVMIMAAVAYALVMLPVAWFVAYGLWWLVDRHLIPPAFRDVHPILHGMAAAAFLLVVGPLVFVAPFQVCSRLPRDVQDAMGKWAISWIDSLPPTRN